MQFAFRNVHEDGPPVATRPAFIPAPPQFNIWVVGRNLNSIVHVFVLINVGFEISMCLMQSLSWKTQGARVFKWPSLTRLYMRKKKQNEIIIFGLVEINYVRRRATHLNLAGETVSP